MNNKYSADALVAMANVLVLGHTLEIVKRDHGEMSEHVLDDSNNACALRRVGKM